MVSSIEVAKKAGVSQATVSRVLNDSPKVSRETREKVLRVIEELKYYPNLVARSLVTSESKTIFLVSGTIDNDFFVETTEAIVNYATEIDYNVSVYFNEENKRRINDREILNLLKGGNVSGILLSSIYLEDPLLKQLENSKVPYMLFNRRPKNGGNYVVLDNVQAASILVDYLTELRHEKIAYISSPYENISTLFERKMSFDQTMISHGLDHKKYARFIQANYQSLKYTLEELLFSEDPPTAIICATDHMAIICMDILMKKGVSIPSDVSIAGFDNNKITSHQAIQLTTVSHETHHNIGCIAVEKLFNLIDDPKKNENIRIKLTPKLYERRTTAFRKREE